MAKTVRPTTRPGVADELWRMIDDRIEERVGARVQAEARRLQELAAEEGRYWRQEIGLPPRAPRWGLWVIEAGINAPGAQIPRRTCQGASLVRAPEQRSTVASVGAGPAVLPGLLS